MYSANADVLGIVTILEILCRETSCCVVCEQSVLFEVVFVSASSVNDSRFFFSHCRESS